MSSRKVWMVLLWGALLFPSLVSAQERKLPEGHGREILTSVCQQCHGIEGVLSQRHPQEDWKDLVNSMVSNGAPLTDEEVDTLSEYLGKNFGPANAAGESKPSEAKESKETKDTKDEPARAKVNVNQSTAKELESNLNLSEKEAGAIVSYREKNGKFSGITDLKKVGGLDGEKIDAAKDQLEF